MAVLIGCITGHARLSLMLLTKTSMCRKTNIGVKVPRGRCNWCASFQFKVKGQTYDKSKSSRKMTLLLHGLCSGGLTGFPIIRVVVIVMQK